ncbi:MAG: hypothetical protein QOJ64_4471 [Acidobacteriota bacterium]|jgi:hypothetical protein|nr:hypothetical protein [Acidobacteriota bacterium]
MKNALFLLIACFLFVQVAEAKKLPSAAQQTKVKRLTGTYRSRTGEFKVQGLGVNRLHVQFNGTYEYKLGRELMANTGTADAMVQLKGNVANFVPPDTHGCSISLTFVGNKLVVRQTGSDSDCGFGHNVTADGTYIKRSSRPPKFDEQ